MRKKILSRITHLILTAFVLISGMGSALAAPISANAESGTPAGDVYISDAADLLSESDEQDLYYVMKPGTEYGNMLFLTITDSMGYETKDYIEMIYQTTDSIRGTDSVIYMIDMDNRLLWITGYGGLKKTISPDYGNLITDNVYTYAGNGQYKECAVRGFEMIISRLEGERISGPLRTMGNLSIAIIFAAVFCFLFAYMMSASRKVNNTTIISGVDKKISMDNPQIYHTTTQKIYDPPSSSGSGGGSRGGFSGGGGGGFSGGGGGHGF